MMRNHRHKPEGFVEKGTAKEPRNSKAAPLIKSNVKKEFNSFSIKSFCKKHKFSLVVGGMGCAVLGLCLFSDSVWATTLEKQLDTVNTLATGKIKKYGVSTATILGFIWSLVKGNIKFAGLIIVIGVTLSLYLGWIEGGMKLG